MFEALDMAPPDAILGLKEAFDKDPNPTKINLSVGVYKDAQGKTPVFASVKEAEKRILAAETSKSYLPIDGAPDYGAAVQAMLLGAESAAVRDGRAATSHTPGGTGALRIAAEFLHNQFPAASIWVSEPTWANHQQVFAAAGLPVKTYPYYDPATHGCAFDAMAAALDTVPAGDAVLLHGCCHNPTGIDPSADQWQALVGVAREKGWLPFFDLAYQGLADGLDEDVQGLRQFAEAGLELLVCSSFSKNFSLYKERVGALTLLGHTADAAARAQSHVKKTIRACYSNPPAHGAQIVVTILNDADLRADWEQDVKAMRDRINGMRALFVKTLEAKGVDRDFSFIAQQKGMFSFSGLTKDQVQRLRDEYGVYAVGSGRINVAGMTEDNMDALCTAIKAVL